MITSEIVRRVKKGVREYNPYKETKRNTRRTGDKERKTDN